MSPFQGFVSRIWLTDPIGGTHDQHAEGRFRRRRCGSGGGRLDGRTGFGRHAHATRIGSREGKVTAAAPALTGAGALAQAASASTPVTKCPVGQPCVIWQDTNTTGGQQDIELIDHLGSPIFWCDNTGGCWVRNDKLGVTGSR